MISFFKRILGLYESAEKILAVSHSCCFNFIGNAYYNG